MGAIWPVVGTFPSDLILVEAPLVAGSVSPLQPALAMHQPILHLSFIVVTSFNLALASALHAFLLGGEHIVDTSRSVPSFKQKRSDVSNSGSTADLRSHLNLIIH